MSGFLKTYCFLAVLHTNFRFICIVKPVSTEGNRHLLRVYCSFSGRGRQLTTLSPLRYKQVFLFVCVWLLTESRMVMLLICGRCLDKEVDLVFTAWGWVGTPTLISTCRINKPTNYPLRGKTSLKTIGLWRTRNIISKVACAEPLLRAEVMSAESLKLQHAACRHKQANM